MYIDFGKLFSGRVLSSYHQHDASFGLDESVRIAHHDRIDLGWGHRLTVFPDMKPSPVYDLRNLFCAQTSVPLGKHI